ncbi:MAG: serine hydrolase [Syntrophobacteraceae bacterium]
MRGKRQFRLFFAMLAFCSFIPQISHALEFQHINARSAILYDMASGRVLYEQNADLQIPPASLTKILTLYLTFEAIDSGRISLSDTVRVSRRAASMPNVRMGLRTGDMVTVAQLIRGMAIESGNDAACAMAEYLGGSVEGFVAKMNAKARELGMTNSHFMTPNGLPAPGQLTTARDIMKLSAAYLKRFPEALSISSTRSFCYHGKTDHNPNNLLGCCPGVDGLKTGFTCASGFNISATAMRDHTRLIAVVLGAVNPWIRRTDAETMLEEGYRSIGGPSYALSNYPHPEPSRVHEVVSPAEKLCKVRRVHGAKNKRSRLAARSRSKNKARKVVLKAKACKISKGSKSRERLCRAAATDKRGCASRRTASKTLASRTKKSAGIAHAAKSAKHSTSRHPVISKRSCKPHALAKGAVHKKKAACTHSAKVAPKTRSAAKRKSKTLVHKKPRIKTATKKKRHCARNCRNKMRPTG